MTDAMANASCDPTFVSVEARKLIGDFFALADDTSKSAGSNMASKIFTKDAVMKVAVGKFQGSEAIAKSRDHAWDVISKRLHEVSRIYTFDSEGSDLLLTGSMKSWGVNGGHAEIEFVARIVTESTTEGLRMRLYEVWADQTPVKQMLSKGS